MKRLSGLVTAAALLLGASFATAHAVPVANINPNSAPVEIAPPGAGLNAFVFGGGNVDVAWFFNINTAVNLIADTVVGNANNVLIPLTLQIFDDNGVLGVQDAGDVLLATTTTIAPPATAQLLNVLLASPGDYFVRVFGTASGTGFVSGNISLTEVPLPGALTLFATGLIGLVALSRRRKRNPASQTA